MLSALEIERREGFEDFLARDINKELLRFTTAGSVDDGKSTLIGRLLHDSKAIYEDQLASVRKSRVNRSGKALDFALLTDGLRAEREQGITIDVAYRYFSTPRRKFIIADTPGHEQYTRNMATGASTADLAIILLDATKGVLPQTRRHAYITSLLGIPTLFAAINKMDLVNYREDVFENLKEEFSLLARSLAIPFVQCIPISALEGDNVVARSANMPWYFGATLMEHLEKVEIHPQREFTGVRFPIQYVIRPDASFRGFAGRLASGAIHPGDSVLALPSRRRTKVKAIVSYDGELENAIPSQSVILKLDDEIDLSRGDMLVSPDSPPRSSSRFTAMVVWLHEEPLRLDRTYLAKHAGRYVKAKATRIRFRVNIDDLTEYPAEHLEVNEIAAVEFATSSPIFFDSYEQNRATGSFILIDPISNATVGAAMMRSALLQEQVRPPEEAPAVRKQPKSAVTSQLRFERHGHPPAAFCVERNLAFAQKLESELFRRGFEVILVSHEAIPEVAFPALISAFRSAGFFVVYFSDRISPEHRANLEAAGEFLFDCSLADSSSSSQNSFEQAIAFAESLRPQSASKKEGAVDGNAGPDPFGRH